MDPGNFPPASGGAIYNSSDTITLNKITLKTAGDTIYNSTGDTLIIAGVLSFDPGITTTMLANAAADDWKPAGNLTFDLSAMDGYTPNKSALISDWSRVDKQGAVSITVSGNQTNGNYRLASKRREFHLLHDSEYQRRRPVGIWNFHRRCETLRRRRE